MIRGRFSSPRAGRRPFVVASVQFPASGNRRLDVRLLVDTGADSTVLGPRDALRLGAELGIDLSALPHGRALRGVGGLVQTRTIEAEVSFVGSPVLLPLPALSMMLPVLPLRPVPSLLGRDLLAHFALFMEEHTGRVLLLEPDEANQLPQQLLPLP